MNYSIKDIANKAGVSVATVSRVINDASSVKDSTKERVEAVIRETGYVPNIAAQNLKTSRSKLIGFIVSNISNDHFTSMSRTVSEKLHEQGYSLIVGSTGDNPERERELLNKSFALQLDGLILNTTCENNDLICELSHLMPLVLVDRSISCPDFRGDFVGSNNFAGTKSLTHHLIANGHRDIAIVTSNLHTSTGRERLAGFADEMRQIGVNVDDNYCFRYDCRFFNQEDGYQACKELMSKDKKPTAFVVANNAMAIGVYQYLRENHYDVPDDVSVVSYGSIKNYELFRVQPTFTTLNPEYIGNRAAELLLSRIDNPDTTNKEVFYEPQLINNQSVKDLR